MSGLTVVAAFLTKSILLKRPFAQDEFSKFMYFKWSRLVLSKLLISRHHPISNFLKVIFTNVSLY